MVSNLDGRGYNFRFNANQWLIFAAFVDFIYQQHRSVIDDLVWPGILRAVGQSQVAHNRGVNVKSLADALDLPRETVRRKCVAMVEEGWLVREGNFLLLGEKIDAEIFAKYEETLERMLSSTDRIRHQSDVDPGV